MSRILITGSRGFMGTHLIQHLRSVGEEVFGFDLRANSSDDHFFQGELTDHNVVKDILNSIQPNVIFHLAGVIKSSEPETLFKTNFLGTVSLLDQIMESECRPIVVVPSSSAVYGPGNGRSAITENFRLRPMTHYAVSKLAQESAALRYWNAFQLPVIVLRLFNLLGPGQSPDLACSAFARQIALAEVQGTQEITTGALTNRRDFIDVRDVAQAFVLAVEKGRPGQVYNVCSGRAVLMRKCLDELLSMSPHPLKVRIDADRFQKNDVPVQVGSYRKLNQRTGWRPKISLKQSLSDLLEYWRRQIKSELE
jgi:GDP-4-dehydro-6-deoxy-D-mannose reductase